MVWSPCPLGLHWLLGVTIAHSPPESRIDLSSSQKIQEDDAASFHFSPSARHHLLASPRPVSTMIKRHESTASSATPPEASLQSFEAADQNGKDKKAPSVLEIIQRWLVRNGKLMVICTAALLLSVFLIPLLNATSVESTSPQRRGTATTHQQQMPTAATNKQPQTLQIPPCPTSPWKPNENMQGKCPGDLKPHAGATSMSQCASSCCTNEDCITWQYRKDVGCLQGKDVRLGMEKDGVSAWCSDHAPVKWQGQFLKPTKKTKGGTTDEVKLRNEACNVQSWNPNEEIGQCFGLGDVHKDASGSAEECMRACCKDEKCGAWQWNKEVSLCKKGGGGVCAYFLHVSLTCIEPNASLAVSMERGCTGAREVGTQSHLNHLWEGES